LGRQDEKSWRDNAVVFRGGVEKRKCSGTRREKEKNLEVGLGVEIYQGETCPYKYTPEGWRKRSNNKKISEKRDYAKRTGN